MAATFFNSKDALHLLPLLLALFCATTTSYHTVNSLSFTPQQPQIKLPNFLSALTGRSSGAKTFVYTHLEGNGQLWQASNGNNKVSVVIDPLASQLDFGVPWGYRANKKSLSEQATIHMICNANPSHCLLTMGLDDHTHLPTIEKLMERMPKLQYVVAPSCEKKLLDAGVDRKLITVLKHGQSCELENCGRVTATEGALVGPPWQTRENGFLLALNGNNSEDEDALSIYYEPHADVVLDNIKQLRADVMVSPVTKQSLPAQVPKEGQFTLVYGGDRTLEIAETLGAKIVVPLGNGELDIEGPLAKLVEASGGVDEFEQLVDERNMKSSDAIRVEKATPGVTLSVSL